MTTETRIRKLERSVRLLTTKSLIRDNKYHITYKGEILLTYDFNPNDKIKELISKLETAQKQVADLSNKVAQVEVNLQGQEADNAQLIANLRTACDERDSLVIDKKGLEADLEEAEIKLDDANTAVAQLKSSEPIKGYSRLDLLKIAIKGRSYV